MNSQTIKENGFAEFVPLKELSIHNLYDKNGHVFVLVDKTLSGKPASDILYIGRAKKPIKKVFGGYISGSGGKTVKKIHNALFKDGYIEKVSISLMATSDPKKAQKELLEKFKKEHGEYPSWNAPKKEPQKPKSKQQSVKIRRARKSATPTKQKPH
jgi:hypothetical protein